MQTKNQTPKIKSLYLPLREYSFDHGPSDKFEHNENFVGRSKIKNKLKLLLEDKNTKSGKGAYLVTGYRGMGKTSLVREVIREINGSSKDNQTQHNLKSFEVALSQDEVQEIDLLRQIAWKLDNYIKDNNSIFGFNTLTKSFFQLISFIISICLTFYIVNNKPIDLFPYLINPFEEANHLGHILLFFGLLILVSSVLRAFTGFVLKSIYNRILNEYKSKKECKIKLKKLTSELRSRLYSSVTSEDIISSEFSLGANNPVTYISSKLLSIIGSQRKNKNTRSYQQATPKDIEQYLYSILQQINIIRKKLPDDNKHHLPPFVFIIDELDKVEPDYYFTPGDKESDKNINHNKIPYHVETKDRRRNEAISRLLANLKNFLNNAHAKFVFIGGRGMYDASLADIADRESFYSSIFNDVLYVQSFFKDKLSSQPNISQLTEAYICHLLTDSPDFQAEEKKEYTLARITEYYNEKYPELQNAPHKLFKIIHTLQNFIIYLTYRSNGSPKKLIELVESHIINLGHHEKEKIKKSDLYLENLTDKNLQFHLNLSFKDQYQINLHSNIYRPYLIINSKHLKSLGDKLLYSTAFIIDHVLKFHKSAFSWRNLEQIPDIILASKDPNFRQFFNEIMNFLQKQHLRKTINTVYQYKFNSKITNEIKYCSKISESSSAAFNFTLDESYHLKSYYRKKLAAKYNEYAEIASFEKTSNYIYTIGYLHSILGDLHYYDEEYDDAIVHYSDTLQYLRSDTSLKSPIQNHNYVLLVRISLNIGLCFEKTRMYDRAYSTYRSLILELSSFYNAEDPLRVNKEWERPFKRMQLFQRPHLALLEVIEKDRQDGITYDNLERNLYEYLKFLKLYNNELSLFPLNRNTLKGENSIMVYEKEQPIVLLDKSQKEGIEDNLEAKQFINTDKKRKVTLIADYYFSVGSILFYKNQLMWRLLYSRVKTQKDNKYFYTNNQEQISKQIYEALKSKSVNYNPSHSGYLYYLYALVTFNVPYTENITKLINDGVKSLEPKPVKDPSLVCNMKFVTNYFHNSVYKILNGDQFDFLGNILGKLGDAVLACLDENSVDLFSTLEMITAFTYENVEISKKRLFHNLKSDLSLSLVFGLYRLAYLCFQRSGKAYSAAYQYKKMLYILKDTIVKGKHNGLIEENVIDNIASIVLKYQVEISGVSNRIQLMKYREYTNYNSIYTQKLYTNLSTSPEVKEIIMLIEGIKIKLGYVKESSFYIGEYSTISSMFTRILELKFRGDQEIANIDFIRNGRELEEIIAHFSIRNNYSIDNFDHLRNSVINAFFCFYEVLRTLKTYGVNYILSHSFNAAICQRMGHICLYYEVIKKIERINNPLKDSILDKLKELLGNHFMYSADAYEYLDLAKQHYKAAIDLHSEGATYKEISKEMYFLDDDYNDNLTHFCAASERYRINTGRIDKALVIIEGDLSSSDLINYNRYV